MQSHISAQTRATGSDVPAARWRRRGSYGFDAPYLLPIPLLLIAVNLINGAISGAVGSFVAAGAIAACVLIGLHASLRGKFVVWNRLLDQLNLGGAERILDLGCGRGAVLLLAAGRLTSGRAVGIDLWRRRDQSGNAPGAVRRNAAAEGVAERVELCTADMIALPFADGSFDFVVSSIAIHNVRGRAGRDRAIGEAVRILRPGGRLMIADLFYTRQYRRRLAELGMSGVARKSLGWQMWWTGPWMATRLVTALKPDVDPAISGESFDSQLTTDH